MAISSDKLKFSDKTRLGELLISWNLLSQTDLKEACNIANQTKMPIGKVLVMSGYINEKILKASIEIQTLIRHDKIDFNQATLAIKKIKSENLTVKEALDSIGYQNIETAHDSHGVKLGDILIGSRLITANQLEAALTQSKATGMPFGRMLVLCGVLSDSILTAALNAQILVRDKKVTLTQAIEALAEIRNRRSSIEEVLIEKGFYQLPKRHTLRIGELLVLAGIINEAQLVSSLEIGLITKKPIGEVLITNGYITSDDIINQALKLQNMVGTDSISNTEAIETLKLIFNEKIDFNSAITKVKISKPNQKITLNNFLQLVGKVKREDLHNATYECLQDDNIYQMVVQKTNIIKDEDLKAGIECINLIDRQTLTLEHACIAYDYCRQKNISLLEALIELEWYQPNEKNQETLKAEENLNLPQIWQLHKTRAEEGIRLGDFEYAENEAFQCLLTAEQIENDNPRLANSLDFTAEILCRQGKFPLAEPLFRKSLGIKEQCLGQSNVVVATAISNLAKLFYFQRQYQDAEEYALKALGIYETVLGLEHPDVACSLHNLATLYHVQEQWDKAEPTYKRALNICRKKLGNDHPATIRLLKGYANLLKLTNRNTEAVSMHGAGAGFISGSWKAISLPPDQMLNWKSENS